MAIQVKCKKCGRVNRIDKSDVYKSSIKCQYRGCKGIIK